MRRRWPLSPCRRLAAAAVVAGAALATAPPHLVAAALPSGPPPGADGAPPRAGWQRPALLTSIKDPVYGTPVRRLTTASNTNEYKPILRAGLQVEHLGGELVLLYEGGSTSIWNLNMSVYKRANGRRWTTPPVPSGGMPHWRRMGPPAVTYFRGSGGSARSLEPLSVDVETGVATGAARPTVARWRDYDDLGGVGATLFSALPTAYLEHWMTAYPSADGSRSVWWTDAGAGADVRGVAVLDLSSAPPALLGTLTSWPQGWGRLLSARITPSGRAVLVSYEAAGVYVYDAAMSSGRRVMATRLLTDDAADVMVAAGGGRDTLVAINDDDGGEDDAGWMVAVDLVSLTRYPLFPLPRDGGPNGGIPRVTVSAQATARPGWVVLSADTCEAGRAGDWLCGKVVAMEVASRRVVPLGHTYNCGDSRERPTAAATPNRDLSRVYYTSDSGSCRGTMELFEMDTAGRFGPTSGGGGGGAPPPPPPRAETPPPSGGGGGGPRGVPTSDVTVGIAI